MTRNIQSKQNRSGTTQSSGARVRMTTAVVDTLEARRLFAAGDMDLLFGTDGVLIDADGSGNGITVEAGGKLIVVGTATTLDPTENADDPVKLSSNYIIRRYLGNGSIDRAAIVDFSTPAIRSDENEPDYVDSAKDVVIDPITGEAVVLGTTTFSEGDGEPTLIYISLLRYNFNLPEPIINQEISISGFANGLAVGNDGALYVAGALNNRITGLDFALLKYTSDLQLDTTFGSGFTTIAFEGYSSDTANDLIVQPDGKIVVVGVSDSRNFDQYNGRQQFIVARFNPDGTRDTAFGTNGLVQPSDFGGTNASAESVALQPDGKIIVGGTANGKGTVVRLNANGTLDTSFGSRGIVSIEGIVGNEIGVQADGRVVLMGQVGSVYGALRLEADGKSDVTFGTAGLAAADMNGLSATASAGFIQPRDGKIVITGTSNIGSFVTTRQFGDAVAPTAALNANDLNTGGGAFYDIEVVYTDDTAVDVGLLGTGDVIVTNSASSFSQVPVFQGVVQQLNDRVVIATYRVSAPGGTWDESDDGVYVVSIQAGQVADTSGNVVVARPAGNFQVNIGLPISAPPTAVVNAPPLIVGGGISYIFTVQYTDDTGINVSTIDANDILITGPNFFSSAATFVSLDSTLGNGTPRTATYSITAPGGTWDISDNGTYSITMRSAQVADTDRAANYVPAGTIGQFSVSVTNAIAGGGGGGGGGGGTPSNGAPVATLVPVPQVTSALTQLLVTVNFTDDNALFVNSIINNNAGLRVTGPHLYNQLAQFVSINIATNGTARSATFAVPAPDGQFDPYDNGTYAITVVAGQFRDVGTTPAFVLAGTIGTFLVGVPYATAVNGQLLVNGTDFDDTITVTSDGFNYRIVINDVLQVINASVITAGVSVKGFAGNDSIVLGAGINGGMVGGGPGNDSIYGSDGDDNLSGGQGDDLIRGNDGNDVLLGRVGNDTVGGGKGDDYVGGGQDVDQLFGGDGDDTLFGGTSSDFFDGGAGNDLLRARDGTRDTILGGEGDDSVEADFGLDYGVDALIQV